MDEASAEATLELSNTFIIIIPFLLILANAKQVYWVDYLNIL